MRLDLARTPAAGDLAVRGDELGGAARVVVFVDEAAPEALRGMKRGEGEVVGRSIDTRVPTGTFRATVWSVEPPLAALVAALVLVAIGSMLALFVLISGGQVEAADAWAHLQVWGTAYLVLTITVVVVRRVWAMRMPQAVVELARVE